MERERSKLYQRASSLEAKVAASWARVDRIRDVINQEQLQVAVLAPQPAGRRRGGAWRSWWSRVQCWVDEVRWAETTVRHARGTAA